MVSDEIARMIEMEYARSSIMCVSWVSGGKER